MFSIQTIVSSLRRIAYARAGQLPPESGFSKILNNLIWLSSDKLIKISIGLFVGIWMARYLGPHQFGLLNYALSIIAIFAIISRLGLDTVVVREISMDREKAADFLAAALILRLIGVIACITIIIGIAHWIHADDSLIRLIVSLLSLSLLFKTTDVAKHWFEAKVESHHTVRIETSICVISGLIKIALILLQTSLLSFVILLLVESIITALGMLWILYRNGPALKPSVKLRAPLQSLIKNSWPLMFANLAVMIYMRVDIIMLEMMSDSHEVGIYAAATKVSEAWYFVPVMIMGTLSPYIMRAHRDDRIAFQNILGAAYFALTWLALALTLPIIFFSKPLISVMFGSDYEGSALILSIHLWASVAIFLSVASSQYLLAENLQKISLYRSIIGASSNLAMNFALIPKYGATGAAIATLVSYYLSLASLFLFKATRPQAWILLLSVFRYKSTWAFFKDTYKDLAPMKL